MNKKMLYKLTFIMLTIIGCTHLSIAQTTVSGDDIIGVWESGNGKARVNIIKSGNYYYGRVVWLKEPLNEEGKPKVDKNNSDETKRNIPLLGLKLLSSFEYKSENSWEDGTIYDPESGTLYNCKINLEDNNTMNIRGYIGISAFGRTDVWKRLQTKKKS